MAEHWIASVYQGIIETSQVWLAPSSRLFWPFLLSSFLLGALWYCVVLLRSGVALSSSSVLRRTREVALHPSSLLDVRLVVAKSVIRVLFLAPLVLSALSVAIAVNSSLRSLFGLAPQTGLSSFQITFFYTVVLFLAWDLSRFALHHLMHKIPFLWELHKVHHSAEVLTPLTNSRTHPLESLLYDTRGAFVAGVVSGVFFYLFNEKAVQLNILGVNALGLVFNAAGANLRHSHLAISYGSRLEKWFISPAQHQIHHSLNPTHFGKNFGSFLALWDRLAGSLCAAQPSESKPMQYGLVTSDLRHNPLKLSSTIYKPVVAAFLSLVPKSWYARPGRARGETGTSIDV